MVVTGIGRTSHCHTVTCLGVVCGVVWSGVVWCGVGDQLIIYLATCGARSPAKIIWIRQTGAQDCGREQKNVMNHQVIDIL